jgi:hypothetical protein
MASRVGRRCRETEASTVAFAAGGAEPIRAVVEDGTALAGVTAQIDQGEISAAVGVGAAAVADTLDDDDGRGCAAGAG